MFDEREDKKENLYLIYILNDIDSDDIINFIQLKKMTSYYKDNEIYISYINKTVIEGLSQDLDYRLFENRLDIEKIISYNNISNNAIYSYPIIIFSKNKDTIVKNSKELKPENETYGVIGE